MKSDLIKNSAKGVSLGLFLLLGIMAFSATETHAQWRDDRSGRRNDRYGGNGGYYGNDIYREARQRGYQDGIDRGRNDAFDRKRYNPEKSHEYKKATDGYNSRMGNKNAYKDTYRQAFMDGYNQGYNRSGRYNGNNGRRVGAILGDIFGH